MGHLEQTQPSLKSQGWAEGLPAERERARSCIWYLSHWHHWVPSSLHISHFISLSLTPILQARKLRLRITCLSGSSSREWRAWDLSPGGWGSNPQLLSGASLLSFSVPLSQVISLQASGKSCVSLLGFPHSRAWGKFWQNSPRRMF